MQLQQSMESCLSRYQFLPIRYRFSPSRCELEDSFGDEVRLPLQQSGKISRARECSVARQEGVDTGVLEDLVRFSHSAFYFTKSEVKGKPSEHRYNPVFIDENRCQPWVFTPDLGGKS